MGLGPQIISNGNIQSSWVLSVTLTPVSVAASSTVEQSFTVNGLALASDQVSDFTYQGAYTLNVSIANARVSANNTLTVAYSNQTVGAVVPPSGTYYLEINRVTPGLSMTQIV